MVRHGRVIRERKREEGESSLSLSLSLCLRLSHSSLPASLHLIYTHNHRRPGLGVGPARPGRLGSGVGTRSAARDRCARGVMGTEGGGFLPSRRVRTVTEGCDPT